jgi:chromosome segregation ATPase
VVVTDTSRAWQWMAVFGSLAIQLGVLAILAWRLLAPLENQASPEVSEQLTAVAQTVSHLSEAQRRDAELNAKIAMLDTVVAQLPGGQQRLVSSLVEKTKEIDELQAGIRGHRALEAELDRRVAGLQTELKKTQSQSERLAAQINQVQNSLDELEQRSQAQLARISELQADDADQSAAPGADVGDDRLWKWTGLAIGATAGILAVCGIITAFLRRKRAHESFEVSEESDPQPNKK